MRSNLTKHNYRNDLKQAPKAGDPDNIHQMRKGVDQMPRYKISLNRDRFNLIFKLLEYNTVVYKDARGLMLALCTNPEMFWNVLWLNERPADQGKFTWEMIFNPEDINFTMYTLEIVDSII